MSISNQADDILVIRELVSPTLIESVLYSMNLGVRWEIQCEDNMHVIYVYFKHNDPSASAAWYACKSEINQVITKRREDEIKSLL